MDRAAHELLKRVLTTPSPSGYESPLQAILRDYASAFADEVSTDVHGNVIAVRNPGAPVRVMLAGHCDQIGLIVQHVDDNGYVYLQQIGGWDPIVLVGQRMNVWTASGPVFGVIARKPIHLLTDEEKTKAPKLKDMWLDIGAADKTEAQKMVRIGDPVTVELEYREMANNRAASPGMDDKCGAWVVFEALRRANKDKLRCALYAVSTVQEEVGLRGARTSAFGIDPHVGVAVDVTFATDCPTIEKKEEGDVSLGKGPVVYRGPNFNPMVVQRLIETADTASIGYQLAAAGRPPGTDANAMQINRAGVATGLVSIPNRYMHSPVEVISLDDIDRAADLLARFAEGIDADVNFVP
ncbi:MAG: M42 family metallopeptidase [Pirellulales bacterium]|nr:M42 family metallopeptidase [Pirellulales bacterium]